MKITGTDFHTLLCTKSNTTYYLKVDCKNHGFFRMTFKIYIKEMKSKITLLQKLNKVHYFSLSPFQFADNRILHPKNIKTL